MKTGANISGCLGPNANVVNAVTAIFLATGQDVASAAESVASLLEVQRATPEQIALYQRDCLHPDEQEGVKLFYY